MDDVLRAVVFAQQWISQSILDATGAALPGRTLLAVPYIVPLLLALTARSVVMTLVVSAFAWVGANFLPGMAFSSESVVLYLVLLVASACAAASAFLVRRRLSRTRARCEALTGALRDASRTLDRERFWRRVNGDDRAAIPDDEIRILWERLESSFKNGNNPLGVSRN